MTSFLTCKISCQQRRSSFINSEQFSIEAELRVLSWWAPRVTPPSVWPDAEPPATGSAPPLEDAVIELSSTETRKEHSLPQRGSYGWITRIRVSIQQQITTSTRRITDTLLWSPSAKQFAVLAGAAGMFSSTLPLACIINHNKFWSHNGLEN